MRNLQRAPGQTDVDEEDCTALLAPTRAAPRPDPGGPALKGHRMDVSEVTTMACQCSNRRPDAEVLLKHLETIGWDALSRIAVVDFPDALSKTHHQLLKAERAEALQLGEQVVSIHRRAAERHNRHARQLVGSIREALHQRVGQEDWQGLVSSLNEAFAAGNGEVALRDLRDSCVEALYEADISGEDAAETIRVIDQVLAGSREGLDALARFLDARFSEAEEWLQAPRMGFEARSPQLSGAAIACIVAAVGAAAVPSILACLALGPFAPGCIIVVVGIAAAIVVFGCLTL